MTRIYKGRPIELLAPVGTFQDFQKVIRSAADAVYLGGKQFNMRMHNPKHNLSNEEISQAVNIAHELGKKVYVTFNNMMTDDELNRAKDYLFFLQEAKVDALIIQDFGAVQLIKDLGLDLELHLSVMANVHNEEMLATAKTLGVTRCVISRETSLAEVEEFVEKYPDLEYEYFIHGDMCIAHGAQCYASGVYFGKSGNRGLCLKPCRWGYQTADETQLTYPMAVKDMSLYQHIPELIMSGVNSYKIEGRMRGADYLIELINLYGEAIDRFLQDPIAYETSVEKVAFLENHRVRDLSTAYAFGTPGINNIALDGKREPRIFSHPVEEPKLTSQRIEKVSKQLQEADLNLPAAKKALPKITVTVDDFSAAKTAIYSQVEAVYLSGEVLEPNFPFSQQEIKELVALAKAKQVGLYYALPRMMKKNQFRRLDDFIWQLKSWGVDGLVVSNIGEIQRYQKTGLKMRGNYGLNVYNHLSGKFYQQQGLEVVTLSIEAPANILRTISSKMPIATELIVQGAPTLMYMEHSFKQAQVGETLNNWVVGGTGKENLDLVDEHGFIRKIRVDQYGKNHLLPTKDFCYGVVLPEISQTGISRIRIEAKEYSADALKQVIQLYQEALCLQEASVTERLAWAEKLAETTGHAQSLQTLVFS